MPWKVYHLSPIDYGWEYLPTIEDVAARFARADAEMRVRDAEYENDRYPQLMRDFKFAKELALSEGWEGDYRATNRPRVLFLPDETEFCIAFVWKQDNNGSTFVISPKPLTWLDAHSLT